MAQKRSFMTHQRFILIGILFFHSVNTYMDRAVIASAIDDIKADLGINGVMMGLILGIFAFGYALFQIPSGWFADKYGPRKALTIVVSVWSCFTALTGAAMNFVQMLILRFLFGAGEAGAFPGATQAFYRWLPAKERGIAHGINISGSRLGAAFSLLLMPWLIGKIGWRWTFVVNGLIGIVWATVWLIWFRDNPKDNKKVNQVELDYINRTKLEQQKAEIKKSFQQIFTSLNMSLTMFQYFSSNVTFYICLGWLPSYIKNEYSGVEGAQYYAAIPLVFAAFANWTAGSMVTKLYNKGLPVGSRKITAIVGFAIGVLGLLLATGASNFAFLTTDYAQMLWFVICFGVATFGVDMTLSPSWSFCNDIGGGNSGSISGAMNMVGNIGAALSMIIFPIMQAKFGSANPFFLMAAALNLCAIGAWFLIDPGRGSDRELSPAEIKKRFIAMITTLFLLTAGALSLSTYQSYKANKEKEEKPPVVVPDEQETSEEIDLEEN